MDEAIKLKFEQIDEELERRRIDMKSWAGRLQSIEMKQAITDSQFITILKEVSGTSEKMSQVIVTLAEIQKDLKEIPTLKSRLDKLEEEPAASWFNLKNTLIGGVVILILGAIAEYIKR